MVKPKAACRVYYNGACPVCTAGIEQQRRALERCAAHGEVEVEWIDVDADPAAVTELGADLEFVRERLHLRDSKGAIRVGSEAFLALWALSPRWRWLARLGALPGLRPLFGWCYNRFAARLYRWNRRHGRW